MNIVRQVIHILRKDIRAHLPQIGVLLLLNLLLVFTATESWTESLGDDSELAEGIVQILLIVTWCLLIARVIQEEAPDGKSAYWLTRPYSRMGLLAAKVIFVGLFVHLLTLLAQILIVTASGLPLSLSQLLLDQIVIVALLSLPMMLIAAFTESLTRFVFTAIPAIAVVLALPTYELRGPALLTGAGRLSRELTPELIAPQLLALAIVAGTALVWQYLTRRTLVIAVSSVGVLLLVAAVARVFPEGVEHRVRAIVLGPQPAAPTFSLRPSAERRRDDRPVTDRLLVVELPLQVSSRENFEFLSMRGQVRAITGQEREVDTVVFGLQRAPDGYWAHILMFRSVYDELKDRPVTVRLVVDSVSYNVRETEPIPLDDSPAIIDGRAQCGVDGYTNIVCLSAFGRSSLYLAQDLRAATFDLPILPVRFALHPIAEQRINAIPILDQASTMLATTTRAPSGYSRLVVDIENIRLADWGPE